jgi:hypothetical protein
VKTKHNKKRNTAFVYEALLREATVAILRKDTKRRDTILNIIKKHFKPGSVLRRDLECHRSLYENQGLDAETSTKILREAKMASRLIDPAGLFAHQSRLISDINRDLEPAVFNTFVPNYKTLASIAQIFSQKAAPKDHVLLENEVISKMTENAEVTQPSPDIDNVVIRAFTKKFNNKYETELLDEQKELLTHYISSFADNALELKTFLNEEISRLKSQLEAAKKIDEIKNDDQMLEKTSTVIDRLNEFAQCAIDDDTLLTIMKTQSLVKEIATDVSND